MPSIRSFSLVLLSAVALICDLSAADNVWIGNDYQSNGSWSRSGNWTNNTSPNFQTNNRIVFATNLVSTNMLYNLGGWVDASDIVWDTTFNGSRTLSSTGGGINFATRLENNSAFTQTVSMDLSGGKFGATDIQLNPVNGDLVINGTIYNDYSRSYNIWGNTGRTLTLNSTLGPNATQSSVNFTIQRNTTIQVNTNQLWQGSTTLNGGVLSIGSSGVLGNGTYTGAVALNAYNGTNASLVFGNSANQTMSGAISGSGSLTQAGAGTTTLTGANTYSGATIISGGTLQVGNGSTTGTVGSANITNNASLSFNRSDAITIGNTISGNGRVIQAGTGSTLLSVNNTYSGGSVVRRGTLRGNVSSSFGSGTIVMGDSGTGTNNIALVMDTSSGTTVANAITVSASGTGSVAIGGTNTSASVANVWSGQLNLGRNVQLFANDTSTRSTFSGQITGNGGITVTQGRVTIDNSSNNYAGATVVNSGSVLQINGNEVIPNASSLSLNGTLYFASGGGTETVSALDGWGTAQAHPGVPGNYTLNVSGSNSSIFSGVIANGSGVLALSKGGSSTLTLAGANSYSGTTTISGGVLQVGNAGTTGTLGSGGMVNNASLVVNRSDLITIANGISGSGSVTQAGLGTTVLSSGNSYSGGTIVSRGTLRGNVSSSFGSGTIVMGDASTGTNNISLVMDTSSETTVTNAITVSGLGTGVVSIGGTNTGNTVANVWSGQMTLNTNVQLFANNTNTRSTFTGQITGNGGITVTQGRVTLQNSSNNYAGATVVNAGSVLQITGNELIPNASALSVNGTLYFASGSGTETVSALDGWGNILSHPEVSGNYTLNVSGSNSTTFSGVIANGVGVLGLSKGGTSTLTLAGVNSYTGGTIVNGGSLVLKAGGFETGIIRGTATVNNGGNLVVDYSTGAYPVASTDTINVNGGGTLTLTGGRNTVTNAYVGTVALNSSNGISAVVTSADSSGLRFGRQSASVLSSVGTATNTYAAGMVLTVGAYAPSITVASNNALNLSGSVSDLSGYGGATLTKNGAGTLIFSGSNSYTGPTVISAGALQVGNGSTNGTLGTGNITDNASLVFNRSDSYLASNLIGGTGGITQAGSGTTILTGANNNSGNTLINSGTLQLGNGGTAGTLGSGTIINNSSLVYNLSSAAGSSSTIGSGSVTQAGTGVFTVYQTNTYTGGTYITQGGTIAIASSGALTGTTNINLGTTNSRGTLDVSGKGGSGYTFGTNQQISGNGTITTGATNRTVTVNGTLKPGNSIGTVAVNGNLALGSTAQSVFELGTAGTLASPGISDRTTVTGNLTLGGSLSLLDNANQNGQGARGPGVYRLFTYGGSLSGSFADTPANLIYNNALYRPSLVTATLGVVDLNIAQLAAGSFFTNAISLGAYHVTNSGGVSSTLGISNTVAAGGGSLGVALVSNSGSASISGATNFTNLAPSSSTNVIVSVSKTNAGVTTGTAVFAMNDTGVGGGSAPVSLGSNSITYTATGYNLAAGSVASTNIDLGRIHAGGTFGTTNISLSNSAPNSAYTETLGATVGSATGGASGSGSLTGLAAGSADSSLSVTLTNNTAGTKNGTLALNLTSEEINNSGLGSTALAAQTVNVTGFVYTGQGVWNTNGGSWSSFGNWQQAGGVAGIDGALSANDTATFGSGGSGTVTLDGASPSLQSLTFSNRASSYTISQGSGGSLTLQAGNTNASINVQAGSHSITASVNAASDVTLNTASNSQLTMGGSVSGVGGLNQVGSGTTILSANNSYTGLTKVSGGTLAVNGSIAGDLQVDAGATLKGSGTITGAATISGTHSVGNSPGIQTFGSSLSYGGTSTVLLEFTQNNTLGRGISFDGIDVAGDLTFDPGSVISLSFNSIGSSVNWNDLNWNDYIKTTDGWLLYRVDGLVSGLENVTISGSLLDSNGLALSSSKPNSYFNLYQSGNNVYLNYAVPEPSTYALFGIGALALMIAARRRRRVQG